MAVKIEKTLCPYCGAALKVRPGQNHAICEYCNSSVLITGSGTADAGQKPEYSPFRDPVNPAGTAGPQAGPAGGNRQSAAASQKAPAAGAFRRHALLPPPGFRTGNIMHMLLGGVGYLFLILVSMELDTFLDTIFFLIASLAVVDLCTDWTGFYSGLKGIHSPNQIVRIVMKIFWGFVIFIAWVLVMVILQSVFSL